jgi:hypothetical protein
MEIADERKFLTEITVMCLSLRSVTARRILR